MYITLLHLVVGSCQIPYKIVLAHKACYNVCPPELQKLW